MSVEDEIFQPISSTDWLQFKQVVFATETQDGSELSDEFESGTDAGTGSNLNESRNITNISEGTTSSTVTKSTTVNNQPQSERGAGQSSIEKKAGACSCACPQKVKPPHPDEKVSMMKCIKIFFNNRSRTK